ncbi:MAG: DNA recombination protein RmuC, partial [Polaromonas sp.]
MTYSLEFWLAAALLLANLLLLVWLLVRKPAPVPVAAEGHAELLNGFADINDRLERELRREINDSSRGSRQELASTLATFQQTLVQQSAEATRTQNTQIDAFSRQLSVLQQSLSDTLTTQLQSVSESNARRMGEVRETLAHQLAQLQQTNSAKLDEMRRTVDEKLQNTLEA